MDATEQLSHWFGHFTHYAWRLEVLDDYSGTDGDDKLNEFQRTGRVTPRPLDHPWRRTIESARARGAEIGRTRLVGHPITPYTEYELAVYEDNVSIGEDVRILDRQRLDASWDAAPDVWLFDDRAAFRMLYGERGTWQGAEEIDPAPFVHVRNVVMPLSVPVREYVRDHADQPVTITLPAALAA
jgi:hypothetical protein